MFERFGEVGRILMPPEGISALIEMQHAVDAKKAFKALAYSRFRAQPLYLEWAPGDIFGQPADFEDNTRSLKVDMTPNETIQSDKKKLRRSKKHREAEDIAMNMEPEVKVEEVDQKETIEKTNAAIDREEEEEEEDEADCEPETTLFVKNLNFETNDADLRSKFETIAKVKSAMVSRKRDASNPEKALSMGFGFVQYYRQADTQRALKELQGDLLDGHCLELKLSHREAAQTSDKKRRSVNHGEQGECTKILVRNLPFQASRKEVRQLFATFGELRTLRVPKKIGAGDNNHRGFGFVDYISRSDARRAFEALVHSTHLYGRRLVLEWAKEEEDIEQLREKTRDQFSSGADRRAIGKQKRKMEAIEKDLTVIDDD